MMQFLFSVNWWLKREDNEVSVHTGRKNAEICKHGVHFAAGVFVVEGEEHIDKKESF